MDDPRLTPARPDLAAKYLEGKVKAARFVTGEEFCVIDAIAPLARASGRRRHAVDAGAEGRTRHHLRPQRRRLCLGPIERRRLCRLDPGCCAGKAGGCSDAQGHGAADVCVSGTIDQTAAGRNAFDRRKSNRRSGRRRLCCNRRGPPPAARPCRKPRRHGEGLRRGRRTLRRHALSLGRQELARHRLLRPRPGVADRRRHRLPARQRHAAGWPGTGVERRRR